MIRSKLEDVARMRGYRNARQLADAINAQAPEGETVSYQAIYGWWNNTIKNYAQSTLNKLCAFLDTSPGMLLEYAPDMPADTSGAQPAQAKRVKPRGSKSQVKAAAIAAGM
ncbi:MAG TPA: helix-turn-helix transcriptional regulator [Blastocatellia bacterium]|nr:helix-turn-helix transcriptional regulator [Blastocatellia bacterium]